MATTNPPAAAAPPTSAVASSSASSSSSSFAAAPSHPDLDATLLDLKVCGGDSSKPNAASALSMNGHRIWIWMEITDSREVPAVSHVSFHCPDPSLRFLVEPRVVGVEGRLVLIHASFMREDGEYFMYKAGDPPSLSLLPSPPSPICQVNTFAIDPCGKAEHFRLMGVGFADRYHGSKQVIIVYSSESNSWSAQPITYAAPGCPSAVTDFTKVIPNKAIPIGESRVMWIDFHNAILISDHSVDPPAIQYVPFPPGRELRLEPLVKSKFSSKLCRDVGFSKGLIKFVEVENHIAVACPYPELVGEIDVVSDEQLYASDKKFFNQPELLFSVDGWRIVTWSRPIAGNSWSNRQVLDVAEICSDQAAEASRYRNSHCHLPLLTSEDSNDTVYLKAVDRFGDQTGSVIAVDMSRKQLKDLGTHFFPSDEAYRFLKVPKNSLKVRSSSHQVHGASSNIQQEQSLPRSGNFSRWNEKH